MREKVVAAVPGLHRDTTPSPWVIALVEHTALLRQRFSATIAATLMALALASAAGDTEVPIATAIVAAAALAVAVAAAAKAAVTCAAQTITTDTMGEALPKAPR